MPDPTEEESARHFVAGLRHRMAQMVGLVVATEEQVAATLEQVAQHHSPADAERLRAKAAEAREYAARERERAASYRMRGDDDDQAAWAGRRDQIRRRLDEIQARVDERQAAVHRAAATADNKRADHARRPHQDDESDDARGPDADQSLAREAVTGCHVR